MYQVHGNDFIYNLFGENTNGCHKNFKALFTCQKTLIKTPNKNISKLEGEAYSYVYGLHISTHLDALCHHFHR